MLEDKELEAYITEHKSTVHQEEKEILVDNMFVEECQSEDECSVDRDTSLVEFKNSALSNIKKQFSDGSIDLDEGLKQFVNAVSIVNAVEDDGLKKTLTRNAAKSLKSYTKSITYKDEEKKLERKTSRNEAFYKSFRPILEFDLSHLIGKKQKKVITKDPNTGKKIVTYEQVTEEPKKEYKDRSYGLCLMMIMIMLFIVPYCISNIILAIFNSINAMFECFSKFGRTAFYLCTCMGGIAIIGLFIYVILLVIQALFGVQIFV